jgi:hypothetical protein
MKFRQNAVESDWGESNKLHGFLTGLSEEIQNRLLYYPEQKSLEKLMAHASRIDERLREQRAEERFRDYRSPKTRPPYTPHPSTTVPRPAPPHDNAREEKSGPTPMDIDSVQRRGGPISPSERQRRMEGKLCLVCGVAGHYKYDCPKRKDFQGGQ